MEYKQLKNSDKYPDFENRYYKITEKEFNPQGDISITTEIDNKTQFIRFSTKGMEPDQIKKMISQIVVVHLSKKQKIDEELTSDNHDKYNVKFNWWQEKPAKKVGWFSRMWNKIRR